LRARRRWLARIALVVLAVVLALFAGGTAAQADVLKPSKWLDEMQP